MDFYFGMSIPHQFPSLIEGPIQTVFIVGTGLSSPDIPTVDVLKDKLKQAAKDPEVAIVCDSCDFYELAGAILDRLRSNGRSDSESRLWIADKLGLLDDRRWFGEIGLPLSGNTPRHRALARFVIEDRLSAIVSLNWDALLETALDSVGLKEENCPPRPWKIAQYARVVDNTHMPQLAYANVFPVIKPHGCVRELNRMNNEVQLGNTPGPVTFKLTFAEMKELNLNQINAVDTKVKSCIAACPLIGIGWSASEDYLRNTIVEIAQQVKRAEPDSFTLIDLEWNSEHCKIADAYNKTKTESFAGVKKNAKPSTDCLMLWLQACHALRRMIAMVPYAEKSSLEQMFLELEQPNSNHPIQSWADSWLPAWIRICWRAGAMEGIDPQTNNTVGPFEIPITPRDAHIPLTGMSTKRRDLHAAAKLLVALPKPLSRFNFDQYPGGFLDMNTQYLYLPLPGWKESAHHSDLAALKPFVEALKGMGYVKRISLISLNNQDDQPDLSRLRQLEAQFKRQMPLTGFASLGDAVDWIDLEELGEI